MGIPNSASNLLQPRTTKTLGERHMTLKGKRVAILAENIYQEMELWVPYYRLKEEGAEIKIVGAGGAKSYTSKLGYPVNVDVQADAVSAADFDAVVVPGGFAPDMMRRHEAMVRLVREAAQQGRVVAAICHAGWMLCSAGVLKGRRATSFFSIKDDMINAGAAWVDQDVVVDSNIITSRKPDDLPVFCKAIIRALAEARATAAAE
jgi:protease I